MDNNFLDSASRWLELASSDNPGWSLRGKTARSGNAITCKSNTTTSNPATGRFNSPGISLQAHSEKWD